MVGPKTHRGWIVTFAGTGINLALGVLYAWSLFKGEIKHSIEAGGPGAFRWDPSSINDPYAVCCLVFAFAMILAGRCQDRIGPRFTASLGGLLVGAGFLWIGQTTDYLSWVLGFGVLVGTGIGFGYSAATPPALKWFPPAKTGLIAGLVVSGFGLASVYIAPLSQYLLGAFGLQSTMIYFGLGFLGAVIGLALLLVNPPPGYLFAGGAAKASAKAQSRDLKVREILRTRSFYLLWLLFFIGSGAGLMVIGSVAGLAKKSLGDLAFLAVAIMAVGNAGGRIVAGLLSDRIGRSTTLFLMLAAQAALMFVGVPIVGSTGSPALLVLLATLIGFNYGTNLSLFPSLAKDFWGLKNFGLNYGVLFTAWGVGGFVTGRLSEMLQARTGSFTLCFIAAGAMLAVGASLSLLLPSEKAAKQPEVEPQLPLEEPVAQGA
ncbi:MAG: OFA family MFS transporter [Deltaproteobacteria bacterium]|nr:OFA family MFS transporter [Deltaproteobacteria bacterium]